MNVLELRNWCDEFIKHGDGDMLLNDVEADRQRYEERCNTRVLVTCKSALVPPTELESGAFAIHQIEVSPAVYEDRMQKVKEEVQVFGNYHWEDSSGKPCNPGNGHIVPNPPIYREVEKPVRTLVKPRQCRTERIGLLTAR